MDDDLFFEIKDRDSFIRIESVNTIRYSKADIDIKCKISLKGGSFHGIIYVDISISDISKFHDDLSSLYDKLEGKVSFGDYYYLKVEIKGDGIGHFCTNIIARYNPEVESCLKFNLSFDQTQIEGMVNQLYKIIKAYNIK